MPVASSAAGSAHTNAHRQGLHPTSAHRWDVARAVVGRHEGKGVASAARTLNADALAATKELLQTLRPGSVVELGSGLSTIALAGVVRELEGTELVSLEHDEAYLREVETGLAAAGLGGTVRFVHAPVRLQRVGPWVGFWYDIRKVDPALTFDFVVIDGPPARGVGRFMTLPLLWPRLRPGALLLLDDANRRKLEAVWLDLWQRMYGSALAVARYDRFHKGLGLMMKCQDRQASLSASTWWHYLVSTLDHASRMAVRHVREGWR